MNPADGPPRRVRVTAPRTTARPAPGSYPVIRELAEQSEVGELFVRSLIRSQLRLAVVVAVGFLLILIGIPVLLAVFPQIGELSVFTVPMPWLLLGLGVYPLVISCAALYVRGASRNEMRFRDLVDEDGSP
ncbi:membrane protein [Arthrobacter sp. H20]|uniref:membrane protein n=1 Tax=Arthrobacter sp. H20 TaxID=1267981 RepID=UPI00047EEEC5|nr:membrane protein [Arthrobacter sp. H20]